VDLKNSASTAADKEQPGNLLFEHGNVQSAVKIAAGSDASRSGQAGSFLFLQGPNGWFFNHLATRLKRRGHAIHRVNFNGGDRVFWRLPGAVDFRGNAEQWPTFLGKLLTDCGITDIILFGDCRPLHRAAIALAHRLGKRVHVFEEGYLRPNWITLEADGVNGNSSMTKNPRWFFEAAAGVGGWSPGLPVTGHFARRAAEDVLYTLSTLFLMWRFPSYRTHKPWHPLAEYAAGARRFPLTPLTRRRNAALQQQVPNSGRQYYLFPLQLDADAQVRFHSPFGRMAPAIKTVIESFARAAPADALLVLTEHPLDTGLVPLERLSRDYADGAGVGERVIYLRGGTSEALLTGCRGMVTINSTMGVPALTVGVPVMAMGHAIYDMPELTFQGGLDDFWCNGTAPNAALFDAFRRVLVAQTQVNGGFYSDTGLRLAVEGAVTRLEAALTSYAVSPPAYDEIPANMSWAVKSGHEEIGRAHV
jgi:capsular polysaccharide export protein